MDTTTMTTEPSTATSRDLPTKATLLSLLKFQRKAILLAAGMAGAGLWISVGFGNWRAGLAIVTGVSLGLLNHLLTEWWGLKIVVAGATPTRGQITRSTTLRLMTLAAAAIGAAVIFGLPDGVGVLFGLAIFRLIALVMTTIPLLKELKNQ
jgi:hypothetical protein